jgi:hypothetical protein
MTHLPSTKSLGVSQKHLHFKITRYEQQKDDLVSSITSSTLIDCLSIEAGFMRYLVPHQILRLCDREERLIESGGQKKVPGVFGPTRAKNSVIWHA